MSQTRTESDALGSLDLPADALYGIATQRGAANFAISHRRLGDVPHFTRALALIKRAAAMANAQLGVIPHEVAEAIVAAALEVEDGLHAEHFPIDLLEGSGGTSINMNINEVLANRATQILGKPTGPSGRIHPNDHVNAGQSTNDVVPAAIKLAAFEQAAGLVAALEQLATTFSERAAAFSDVLRVGRTCLQAGQPMTLGQAFGGYAAGIRRQAGAISKIRQELLILPLGGTAIGTGLGSEPGFAEALYLHLRALFGEHVRPAQDRFDAMQNADAFSRLSAELRICAEVLGKIAADLVTLSSDPKSAIGEILLPPVQPGSSIMPGKINPVIPIMVQQTAFAVIGNDTTISLACLHGQLEINHFEPVIAQRLFDSLELLSRSTLVFSERCVRGVEADAERSLAHLLHSPAIASVFLSRLGYDAVSVLVKAAAGQGRTFVDLAIEQELVSQDEVMDLLRDAAKAR